MEACTLGRNEGAVQSYLYGRARSLKSTNQRVIFFESHEQQQNAPRCIQSIELEIRNHVNSELNE